MENRDNLIKAREEEITNLKGNLEEQSKSTKEEQSRLHDHIKVLEKKIKDQAELITEEQNRVDEQVKPLRTELIDMLIQAEATPEDISLV